MAIEALQPDLSMDVPVRPERRSSLGAGMVQPRMLPAEVQCGYVSGIGISAQVMLMTIHAVIGGGVPHRHGSDKSTVLLPAEFAVGISGHLPEIHIVFGGVAYQAVGGLPFGIGRFVARHHGARYGAVLPHDMTLSASFADGIAVGRCGTLVEAQQDLINAWIEIVDAEDSGAITHEQFLTLAAELGNPLTLEFTDPDSSNTVTFTESYAQTINDRLMTDADFKDVLRNSWRSSAIDRYGQVLDDLANLTG